MKPSHAWACSLCSYGEQLVRLFDLISLWEPECTPDKAKMHLDRNNGIEDPIDVFISGDFEEWQRWQSRHYFTRPYVVSMVQAGEPTLWLFAGLYKPTDKVWIAKTEEEAGHYWYDLDRQTVADEWMGRLYLRSPYKYRNSWTYGETLADKLTVVELLPERLSIGAFPGFKAVNIGMEELRILVQQNVASWGTALASVKGIYLITDIKGGLYVGKADGTDGIWGGGAPMPGQATGTMWR